MALPRTRSGSYLEILKQARLSVMVSPPDPWLEKLKRLHGVMGSDGIERVSTSELLERLEVPIPLRARSTRRLAQIMIELGWRPMRVRGTTAHGFSSRLRGFARPVAKPQHHTLSLGDGSSAVQEQKVRQIRGRAIGP